MPCCLLKEQKHGLQLSWRLSKRSKLPSSEYSTTKNTKHGSWFMDIHGINLHVSVFKAATKGNHKKVAGLLIDSRSFERRLMQLQNALNTLVNHALKVLHSAENLRRAVMMKWTCNIMKRKVVEIFCWIHALHLCTSVFSRFLYGFVLLHLSPQPSFASLHCQGFQGWLHITQIQWTDLQYWWGPLLRDAGKH